MMSLSLLRYVGDRILREVTEMLAGVHTLSTVHMLVASSVGVGTVKNKCFNLTPIARMARELRSEGDSRELPWKTR